MKKADLFFNVIRLPVDFVMLLVAGLVTYFLRTDILSAFRPALFQFDLSLTRYLYLVIFTALLFIVAYAISGLYSMESKIGRAEEFFKILVASLAGIMFVIIFIFLRQELFNSRFLVLGGWFFGVVFVTLGRQIIRALQTLLVGRYDFGVHRVLLIGDDEVSQAVSRQLTNNPSHGYRIASKLAVPEIQKIKEIMLDRGIDEIILADPNHAAEKVRELVDFCNEYHIVFKFIPNIYQTLTTNFAIDLIDRFPVIELKRTPLDGWGRVIKRVVDIVGSSVGLVVCSPIFLAIAIAVKLDTPGPVFARLPRISKNKEFILYKFRGMIAHDPDGGAESLKASLEAFNERKDGPLFKIKNDPRLTRVGRVIRKYRLDEMAQFINILKGDISLVGPRPHQPDEIERYEKHHKKVLAIKAGATGLAQVSGSSDLPFEEEVAMDSFYIEHWSLTFDIRIIFRTIFKVFSDHSAA